MVNAGLKINLAVMMERQIVNTKTMLVFPTAVATQTQKNVVKLENSVLRRTHHAVNWMKRFAMEDALMKMSTAVS